MAITARVKVAGQDHLSMNLGQPAARHLDCSLGDTYLNISFRKGTVKELKDERNCLRLTLRRTTVLLWKHCISQGGSAPLPFLILTLVTK